MTSEVRVLTSLEYAAAAAAADDADDDDEEEEDDSSLSTATSSCLVLPPGSSAAAVNGSRPQWSDYSPNANGTEQKLVPAPNRPNALLYHDCCQSVYLKALKASNNRALKAFKTCDNIKLLYRGHSLCHL